MTYVWPVTIIEIAERFERRHVTGVQKEAVFDDRSRGWFVTFDDYTSRFIGMEKPDLRAGDKMFLKLEKDI